jgi:hypothetical protein
MQPVPFMGFANVMEVDDRHAMRAHERVRIEPPLECGQRSSNQVPAPRGV